MKRLICLSVIGLLLTSSLYGQSQKQTMEFSGYLTEEDCGKIIYVPFVMSEGATKLTVTQSWVSTDKSNSLIDLGVFDSRGIGQNTDGFRGWSGGSKRTFEISESSATPGYLPGVLFAGEWNVVMKLNRLVDATWKIVVDIEIDGQKEEPFVPNYPALQLSSTPGWYRIDTHVHTVHSDGRNTPEEIIALGKKVGLDGIISTDHNTTSSLAHWGRYQQPDFLVIKGMEVTTIDGHWNIIGMDPRQWVDFRYSTQEMPLFYAAANKALGFGGTLVANHPFNIDYNFDFAPMGCIEVWNGPWTEANRMAVDKWNDLLQQGYLHFATGGSDYHRSSNVLGLPQTVVYSPSLSSGDILASISAGHSYIAASSDIFIEMTAYDSSRPADKKIPGQELKVTKAGMVSFVGNKSGRLVLITTHGGLFFKHIEAGQQVVMKLPKNCGWVRAELQTDTGEMLALTNPIFVE